MDRQTDGASCPHRSLNPLCSPMGCKGQFPFKQLQVIKAVANITPQEQLGLPLIHTD